MHDLQYNGHEVMAGGAIDGFEKKFKTMGIPFKDLPVALKGIDPFGDLRLLHRLYSWYRIEQPDIVHHFTIKPVIYGSIAAHLARVPKIINSITGLGFVFTEDKVKLLRQFVKLQYRLALSLAQTNIFLNRDDLTFFRDQGLVDLHKSMLLPGEGVDCNYFSPLKHAPEMIFLMMGRLLKDKGVYEFVEAARQVKQKYPQYEFQLLGQPDFRNPNTVSVKELKLWDAQGVVRWLGAVEDVRPILARAQVVVLPSYYREGIPRSLLEAAAMEKPMITTDMTGCREVVKDQENGFLVPVKNVEALVEAMCQMIANPEMRMAMGRKGRDKVLRTFDQSIIIKKIKTVYGRHC